jgi:hypothetical protein
MSTSDGDRDKKDVQRFMEFCSDCPAITSPILALPYSPRFDQAFLRLTGPQLALVVFVQMILTL